MFEEARSQVVPLEAPKKCLPTKVVSLAPFDVKKMVEAEMVLYSVVLTVTVFENAKKHLEIF